MKTSEAIETLENGNIREAKAALGKRSHKAIRETALEMGHGVTRAMLIADWAKGQITWQAYCEGVAAVCNGPKGGR